MDRTETDQIIKEMMDEANRGCGMCYELFENRLREMVISFLDSTADVDQAYVQEKTGINVNDEPCELTCVLCGASANFDGVYCADCVM